MAELIHPIQQINISDFNYNLPDELIARHPLDQRDACRLLVAAPAKELAVTDALAEILPEKATVAHRRFDEITDLIPENALIVRNNTKVINARLHFTKETGAGIEIFLLDPIEPGDYALNFQQTSTCVWKCLVGNLKRWKEGELTAKVTLPDDREITIKAERLKPLAGNAHAVRFSWTPETPFGDVISAFGNIPIPPYLNRESEESDLTDYQTVYAVNQGSVAAPTAGLHFTEELLEKLKNSGKGIEIADVTLHVGAGTFRPVKAETLSGHDMHSERFTISRALVNKLIDALADNRVITAVGTTTVRTIESLPYIGARLIEGNHNIEDLHVSQWAPYGEPLPDTIKCLEAIITEMNYRNSDSLTASTSILIGPGFPWHITEAMITNFHQPESTLLLLVASFLGMSEDDVSDSDSMWRRIYDEAVRERYRFLSYGDACLFFRHGPKFLYRIHVPGSKSISHRLLILNALSDFPAEIKNISDSDDTRYLMNAIEAIRRSAETGVAEDVYIGEGATPFRFAYALASVTPGCSVRFFPAKRLFDRLCGDRNVAVIFGSFLPFLGANMKVGGAQVNLTPEEKAKVLGISKWTKSVRKKLQGFVVNGHGIGEDPGLSLYFTDGCTLKGGVFSNTSQELSAILLCSSRLPSIRLTELNHVPSLPYLLMSLILTQDFAGQAGLKWDGNYPEEIVTSPGELRAPDEYVVEGDWSALLNFYAFATAAKFAPEKRIMGILCPECPPSADSLQPDARMMVCFDNIIAIAEGRARPKGRKYTEAFSMTPDACPPFVAAALSAGIPFKATRLDSLTSKESNRVEALRTEFAKLGYKCTVRQSSIDGLTITSDSIRHKAVEENPLLDSHNDHRIAMALAATLPVTERFRLKNPRCVAKSMPGFWDELQKLGVTADYDSETDVMQLSYSYEK